MWELPQPHADSDRQDVTIRARNGIAGAAQRRIGAISVLVAALRDILR